MTKPFAQRIASMNAMYKLPAHDRPSLPADVVDRLIMDSNESKLGADGRPIYDANGKFLKGPNYWRPEPRIKALLQGLNPVMSDG
jgi:hypothetical protein